MLQDPGTKQLCEWSMGSMAPCDSQLRMVYNSKCLPVQMPPTAKKAPASFALLFTGSLKQLISISISLVGTTVSSKKKSG